MPKKRTLSGLFLLGPVTQLHTQIDSKFLSRITNAVPASPDVSAIARLEQQQDRVNKQLLSNKINSLEQKLKN